MASRATKKEKQEFLSRVYSIRDSTEAAQFTANLRNQKSCTRIPRANEYDYPSGID